MESEPQNTEFADYKSFSDLYTEYLKKFTNLT